jgi:Flp pilus assembly protein TadG
MRKGQALIETSLVLVVLVSFAMGTLDFGQYLYFHQALAERARAAARYGAVNPADRSGIENVAVYNNPNGAAGGASAILPNLTVAMVAVCLPGDRSCANPSSGADARVTVTITGYPMVMVNLFLPRSFTNRPITVSLPSESTSEDFPAGNRRPVDF